MPFQSDIFDSKCIDLCGDNYLHFINIPILDSKITAYIDASIVSICEGASNTDLKTVKNRLIAFLTPKRGTTIEMGAIAEFFGHLYLTEIGFKQEFMFLNLEEGSIKKGFDGYYSINDEAWIYESKSGSIETGDASHENKISLAYSDLKDKISGNSKNNPWQNAYNHASHVDVRADESIRQNLKALSRAFTNEEHQEIAFFNIIPGSTLFLNDTYADIDVAELTNKITWLMRAFSFNKINIICVNKASINLFWEYLES